MGKGCVRSDAQRTSRHMCTVCLIMLMASSVAAGPTLVETSPAMLDTGFYDRCGRTPANPGGYSIACGGGTEPEVRRELVLGSEPARPAKEGSAVAQRSGGHGLGYSLSDDWTARVGYSHSYVFDRAAGDVLRQQRLAEFSTDYERDVVDLQMSWRLSWSRLDLGYRFQSTRPDAALSSSLIPESQATEHSIMLGVTREWGGRPPLPQPPAE
jgi:hypothetical protein